MMALFGTRLIVRAMEQCATFAQGEIRQVRETQANMANLLRGGLAELNLRLTDLAVLSKDYIALRSELSAAQAQLGQLQSSFGWLTEHVNRLERERAELLARVLNVNFPAMRLDRPEASDAPTPTQSRIVGRPAEDDYAGSIPALQAVGALFEDVGDDQAAQLGAHHDAMGNVTWTK